MLKTQLTVMTLGLVTLNGLALCPLYPLVVAAGGVVVHLAVLVYALSDTRTVVSADFVDSAMGPALSVVFVLTSMLIVAVCGGAMGILTRAARRTVIQGVQLEVANAHLGRGLAHFRRCRHGGWRRRPHPGGGGYVLRHSRLHQPD